MSTDGLCVVGCGGTPDPGNPMCNYCWGLLTPRQRRQLWHAFLEVRDIGTEETRTRLRALSDEAIALVKKERGLP